MQAELIRRRTTGKEVIVREKRYSPEGVLTGEDEYDSTGALVSREELTLDNDGNAVQRFTYGRDGNLLSGFISTYDDRTGESQYFDARDNKDNRRRVKMEKQDTSGNIVVSTSYRPDQNVDERTVSDYDKHGILFLEREYNAAGRVVRTSTPVYDLWGRLIRRVWFDSAGTHFDSIAWRYDAASRVVVEDNRLTGIRTEFSYDANGRVSEKSESSTVADGSPVTSFLQYDDRNNLLKSVSRIDANHDTLSIVTYAYEFYGER